MFKYSTISAECCSEMDEKMIVYFEPRLVKLDHESKVIIQLNSTIYSHIYL
ncbi:hypothetical protein M992_2838 [Moellerella wisconsensis ATCC 35017]|uniref:Uncharacterized protein n=1 Tax=Moellerella wisconsensis ATCC 35017 TaxID=1354267 RepID=A0A0N0Z735_9GAMM|nr:hypothetical protein M992_2838 [Moellerella wisconsensis ATCC 35017]VFS54502.1 Uncharacterised protein [Moellerella wisconsensis]